MSENDIHENKPKTPLQALKSIERNTLIGAITLVGIAVVLVVVYFVFFASPDVKQPGGKYEELAKDHPKGQEYVDIINSAFERLTNDDATDDGGAYLDLGFYKKELGDIEGAIAAYEEGIEKFPAHQIILANLAHIYQDRKEYDKAEKNYKQVLEVNPKNTRIIIDLADMYRFYFEGRENEILHLIEVQGLLANPNEINLLLYLANFYRYQLDNRDKAVEYYQKVLAIKPDDRAVQVELRNLLRQ